MIPDRKCTVCGQQIKQGCIGTSMPSSPWVIQFFCDRACLRRWREGRTDA